MSSPHQFRVDLLDDMLELTNSIVTVSFDHRHGLVSLRESTTSRVIFSNAYVLIHTDREVIDIRTLSYKSFSAIEFQEENTKGRSLVVKLQDFERTTEVSLKFTVYEGIAGYSTIVQYKNRGEEVRVNAVDLLVLEVDDHSKIITGWNYDELRFFRNGFHSWELSQALPIELDENVSHMYSILRNHKTERNLLLGFVTTADQFSTITAHGREDSSSRLSMLVATALLDEIPVTENDSVVSEELLVIFSEDPVEIQNTYFMLLREKMKALTWKPIPTGWCSWYFYYTMPDEDEVKQNIEFLSQRFGKEIEWIQLDDGYQKCVGDWTENERFGAGLESLVKKIEQKGYKAGIWTAPFVASEHSELFKDKPAWFVKDENKEPISVGENPLWLGKYYALDLTNPKVQEHIRALFVKLKGMGFEYFKIDFLYHAALPGERYDKTMTRAQAVRKGLEVIREAVGDSLVLGCGAPLGPCIGIVNMMRIGTDIATNWRYEWGGGVYECSVNTMTRAAMHGKLWVNDPDCILVRQDDNELTLDEVLLWLNVVALSGGAVIMSDRMMEVSEERLALIDKILPPLGNGALAIDAMDKENPTLFALPVKSPYGDWVVLGIINLNEAPIDVRMPLAKVGLDPRKAYHIFDFWEQKYHGLVEEELGIFKIDRHSSKLFMIKEESPIPMVLSTSIHFSQGGVEISNIGWNESKQELSLKLNQDTRNEEAIFIVFASDWIPTRAYVNDEETGIAKIAPEVVAVKGRFKKGQEVRVVFNQ